MKNKFNPFSELRGVGLCNINKITLTKQGGDFYKNKTEKNYEGTLILFSCELNNSFALDFFKPSTFVVFW